MNFSSFISDILSTVIGGGILTFLFFLLRERIFSYSNLDGSWIYDQVTHESDYHPYIGIKVSYLALLSRDGNKIYGSAEKISEQTTDGAIRKYVGKHRTRAEITGHIEKQYLSKDRISIHIVENGELRESSTFHILNCSSSNELQGRFSSTISNQIGSSIWRKRSS